MSRRGFGFIFIPIYVVFVCCISYVSATTYYSTTSEPISETNSFAEPSTVSEAEPESTPLGSFEPKSEPEGTTEPGASVGPENEPISESVAEPTSQPEGTVEPGASVEPENEPVSENVSEPTSEPEGTVEPSVTSEPENEPVSESVPEPTSEPEGTVEPDETVKPEYEPVSEGVSEPTSEPGSTVEPGASVEPELEPEANVTSEPLSEDVAEPSTETEVIPETRPSPVEILLPPSLLVIGIIAAIVGLTLSRKKTCARSNRHLWTSGFKKARRLIKVLPALNSKNNASNVSKKLAEPFLTNFDREVLASLNTFYNKPLELVRIALPALISLALCPVTIYLYDPLVASLWPKSKYATLPDINDAIACFLSPAGLVYATSFGFAFQQAMSKQHEVLLHVTEEVSMIDQIATLTSKLRLPSFSSRLEIYRAVKAEIIFMILQIERREVASFQHQPDVDIKVKIWSVLDILRGVQADDQDHMDKILCDKIVTHITRINNICSDRMGSIHTRIHPLKWAFLETLGFFSFLGVLLLQAGGYRIELAMCVLTVISISMLCYVVSDLDSPFSGFFRVDLSVFPDVIKRLETMYVNTSQGDISIVPYPENPRQIAKNKRAK